MRVAGPLIVGAGPAGCAAAMVLGRHGVRFDWIEKREAVGDPLCGGFLSWRGVSSLRGLGIDPAARGWHPINEAVIFVGNRSAQFPLPCTAYGVSRRALDGTLRAVAGGGPRTERLDVVPDAAPDGLFLATGKYPTRGDGRPRNSATLGLRWRYRPDAATAAALAGRIELHLFDGGYAGLLLQEDGSANLAIALRKVRLTEPPVRAEQLLEQLCGQLPELARRLNGADLGKPDSVGAVPYGFVAHSTTEGIFRLGDEAAVIPSLAGEGLSIALASGISAVEAFVRGGPQAAEQWQPRFAWRAQRAVRSAEALWWLAERPAWAGPLLPLAARMPAVMKWCAQRTRLPELDLPR